MAREMYIVGDESRLVVKNLINELTKKDCTIHIVEPLTERLSFSSEKIIHLVLCISEELDFDVIRKLVRLQQDMDMYIYSIGSAQFSLDEERIFARMPSFRFPSYNLNVDTLVELVDKNSVRQKKVLVVDDEPVILRSIKGWLGEGFDVAGVNSGEMALEYLEMHPVDLVLLDYRMPTMDGPFVLNRIRQDNRLKKMPVIFLTSKNDKDSVLSVAKLKPQGYILKSKSPEEIKQAVINFFKNRIEIIQ